MIARLSGATLGLLAFAVAVLCGLWAGNSSTEVLSRAIWSLVVFCALGLTVGVAAQAVIGEYARRRFDAVQAETATESVDEKEKPPDSAEEGAPETC